MDVARWLWERVERRDAPAVLAHALSLAPTRDTLLRQAAITGRWDELAAASADAAQVARHVGWSRSGPDAVTAICQWIAADRTLRGIPEADRAAPLAQAALAAWAAPGELASRLAAGPTLSPSRSAEFERALSDDADWLHEVDTLEAHLSGDPEAVREVLEDDQARTVLLRHAARTGEWEDLADVAADAEEHARVEGTPSAWARQVAQLGAWMAGTGEAPGQEPLTRAELAEAIVQSPWKGRRGGDARTGEPLKLGMDGVVDPTATGPDVAPSR